jgi:hypothetical protein
VKVQSAVRWGLKWCSKNKLDGLTEHIIYDNRIPALFHTRSDARRYADKEFGYIKTRKDLQCEPHGWRFPRIIRVKVNEI